MVGVWCVDSFDGGSCDIEEAGPISFIASPLDGRNRYRSEKSSGGAPVLRCESSSLTSVDELVELPALPAFISGPLTPVQRPETDYCECFRGAAGGPGMHLSTIQRARISAVRRGVMFEDVERPHAHTLVHVGKHHVLTWDESGGPVIGLAIMCVDGLPFVAFSATSEDLRGDIASALGVEPLVIEGLKGYDAS